MSTGKRKLIGLVESSNRKKKKGRAAGDNDGEVLLAGYCSGRAATAAAAEAAGANKCKESRWEVVQNLSKQVKLLEAQYAAVDTCYREQVEMLQAKARVQQVLLDAQQRLLVEQQGQVDRLRLQVAELAEAQQRLLREQQVQVDRLGLRVTGMAEETQAKVLHLQKSAHAFVVQTMRKMVPEWNLTPENLCSYSQVTGCSGFGIFNSDAGFAACEECRSNTRIPHIRPFSATLCPPVQVLQVMGGYKCTVCFETMEEFAVCQMCKNLSVCLQCLRGNAAKTPGGLYMQKCPMCRASLWSFSSSSLC